MALEAGVADEVIYTRPIDQDAAILGHICTAYRVGQGFIVLPDFDADNFRVQHPFDSFKMRAENGVDLHRLVGDLNDTLGLALIGQILFVSLPRAGHIK